MVYLTGNQLGLQPKPTAPLLLQDLQVWAEKGNAGFSDHRFNRPWRNVEDECCTRLAEMVGAEGSEVAVTGGLSSNLNHLMIAFYKPTASRFKILLEDQPFSTDYVKLFAYDVE